MNGPDNPAFPYVIYLVVWTATFVTIALVAVVWFVPAAPREVLTAIAIMFFIFASIITGSDVIFRLLGGKAPDTSQQKSPTEIPKSNNAPVTHARKQAMDSPPHERQTNTFYRR